MKSLAELEREDVRAAFIQSTAALTWAKAGVIRAEKGFGQNDGPQEEHDLDAWFANAKW